MALFFTKNLCFRTKSSSLTPFFTQFVYILSHASDNTTSQNIGAGGGCMGRPPLQSSGGAVPQSSFKSPPMHGAHACVASEEISDRVMMTLETRLCIV